MFLIIVGVLSIITLIVINQKNNITTPTNPPKKSMMKDTMILLASSSASTNTTTNTKSTNLSQSMSGEGVTISDPEEIIKNWWNAVLNILPDDIKTDVNKCNDILLTEKTRAFSSLVNTLYCIILNLVKKYVGTYDDEGYLKIFDNDNYSEILGTLYSLIFIIGYYPNVAITKTEDTVTFFHIENDTQKKQMDVYLKENSLQLFDRLKMRIEHSCKKNTLDYLKDKPNFRPVIDFLNKLNFDDKISFQDFGRLCSTYFFNMKNQYVTLPGEPGTAVPTPVRIIDIPCGYCDPVPTMRTR
jgi:hypothetical protein